MIAIAVGFSGIILVTRPGFGGIHPAGDPVGGRHGLLRAVLDPDAHPRRA